MKKIPVYPERFRQLGEAEDSTFYLVTNSSLLDVLTIEPDGKYKQVEKLSYDPGDSFVSILKEQISEPAHILVITPDCLFESVLPEDLGPHRKILIFACNSAPTPIEAVEHFLRFGEKIDPVEQERRSNQFFEQGEEADLLKLVDEEYGTVAEFRHLSEDYGWHEQLGMLGWGEQQIFPSGEIACFLVPLKGINELPDRRFDLNGEIPLKGFPVVHSGPPSFLREDQERIYQKLATFKDHAVIVTVKDGIAVSLRATHPSAQPALEMLEAMFTVDSRFRQIFEVGFAIKNEMELLPQNSAMNEVYGGENGCVHFGFGMLPYTQYHLDLICPNIKVLGKNDELLIGGNGVANQNHAVKPRRMVPQRVAQCPCLG